jgi:hypothetical protein
LFLNLLLRLYQKVLALDASLVDLGPIDQVGCGIEDEASSKLLIAGGLIGDGHHPDELLLAIPALQTVLTLAVFHLGQISCELQALLLASLGCLGLCQSRRGGAQQMLRARIQREHVIEGLGVALLLMRDLVSLLLVIHAKIRVEETPTMMILTV